MNQVFSFLFSYGSECAHVLTLRPSLHNIVSSPDRVRGSERKGMRALTYEIYCGRMRQDAVCIEAVQGMGNAYELMTKLAARSPGPYYILCAKTHTVCGSIDTSDNYSLR